MIYRLAAFLGLCLLMLMAGCQSSTDNSGAGQIVAAPEVTVFDPARHDWPHNVSDIAPDPKARFGRLGNGLRYVILPSGEDTGGMSLRLQFPAGHIHDPEGKEGLTHLLEHMAFRGSSGVAPDDMLKQLEAIGLSTGQDSNAFTFPYRTMYAFNFPEKSHKSLDKGLFLFSEIAQNLNLDPELLEIERDVVKAEGDLRNVPNFRSAQDELRFTYPNIKRFQTHLIGTNESLDRITAEDLRLFYDQYYRPESALLVITGAVSQAQTEGMVRKHFRDWQKDSVAPPGPLVMDLQLTESGAVYDEAVGANVKMFQSHKMEPTPYTQAALRDGFARDIALEMINSRLKAVSENSPKISWMTAGFVQSWLGKTVIGGIGTDRYEKSLPIWDRERRQVIEFGFTETELQQAFMRLRHNLEGSIAGNFNASSEANQIAFKFREGNIYVSDAQELAWLERLQPELGLEDYRLAFAKIFDQFEPRIRIAGKYATEEKLAKTQAALKASRGLPLPKRTEDGPTEFKFKSAGSAAQIISSQSLRGTKYQSVTFSNGLRVNYQLSPAKEKEIVLNVALRPDFSKMLPRLRRFQDMIYSLEMSDIEGYSKADMRRIFAGKDVSFTAQLRGQNINFNIKTTSEDLEEALSILTTFLQDPDITSETWKRKFQLAQRSRLSRYNASPLGYGLNRVENILTNENSAFYGTGIFITSKDMQDLKRLIQSSPIEVGIAGNFDQQMMRGIMSKTLGTLPGRPQTFFDPVLRAENVKITEKHEISKTYPGTDTQMALIYCWPLTGNQDFETRRSDEAMGELLSLKLTEKIRHDLGVTYGTHVHRRHNSQVPNFSYLCGGVQFEPERELVVRVALRGVVEELAAGQVTREEFNRAVQPMISRAAKSEKSLSQRARLALYAVQDGAWVKDQLRGAKNYKELRIGKLKTTLKETFGDQHMRLIRIQANELQGDMQRRTLKIRAELGEIEAMMGLAEHYTRDGFGPTKYEEAVKWYEKAAAAGHESAEYQLGKIYARQGFTQDLPKAGQFLQAASENGNAEAKYILAQMYQRQTSYFPDVTNEEIMVLLEDSAGMGYKLAMGELAFLHHQGAVVARDYETALMWALTSQTFGNWDNAKDFLSDNDMSYYTNEVSEAQGAKAKERAKAWKAKFDKAHPKFEINLLGP